MIVAYINKYIYVIASKYLFLIHQTFKFWNIKVYIVFSLDGVDRGYGKSMLQT